MHASGHVMSGLLAGVGFAQLAGLDSGPGVLAAVTVAAGATGITSPDVDLWLKGVVRHRGITHWLPTVMLFGATTTILAANYAPELTWVAMAHWVGLLVHLVGDFLFGMKVIGADGPGIPGKGPNSGYVGLGLFRSGGAAERVFTWLVLFPATVAAFKAWSGLDWTPALLLLGAGVFYCSAWSQKGSH
jgi:hypothetical protein